MSNNQQIFLELGRAGLWADTTVHDSWFLDKPSGKAERMDHGSGKMDWEEMYRLAEEQSVIGVVLAGIYWFKVHDSGFTVPQDLLLQWIGDVQILEQQNKAMNGVIDELFEKLSKAGVNALLVKGQGIAQCYDKPLWRCCGDIDLLMDDENYERAKKLLILVADHLETEDIGNKHLGLYIKDFLIELHGAMPFGLSKKVDGILDEVIDIASTDYTNGTDDLHGVAIPRPDEHVIIVFTHFLHHFFIEGVGLRQICDWCRLLWRYRSELDFGVLESRIRKMGLMSEWRVFGALAVEFLGMPEEAMPLYDPRFKVKGKRVLERILKCGNFGHNHDLSYRTKFSGIKYKVVALWRRFKDFAGFTMIFPVDAPKFFVYYVFVKMKLE